MEENLSTPISTEQPENKISTRSPILLWLILLFVAFALGMGAGYWLFGRPAEARASADEQKLASLQQTVTASSGAATQSADQAQVQIPQQVKRYDVPVAGSQSFGSDKAPITLVEFSDYECPFCKQWHLEVWPKIQAKYGDKVRLVYRNFPLSSIHPDATSAAEAAACAGDQQKYFQFGDLLFNGGKQLGTDAYLAYAQQLGLNMDTFKKCIDSRSYQKFVENDTNFASQLGVRSTPTFFINGLAVVGAQPYEVFSQVIDLELAGKIPK